MSQWDERLIGTCSAVTWRRVVMSMWRCLAADCSISAAATSKTRSPMVAWHVDGTSSVDVDAERSRHCELISATQYNSHARLGMTEQCRNAGNGRRAQWALRRHAPNQWRSRSGAVMCSDFRAENTSRSAIFITDWSLLRLLGRPTIVVCRMP